MTPARHLALLLLLAAALPAAAQSKPADTKPGTVDLPITRAVLFSSGVGYFEHAGEVEGDVTMRLQFKTDQINDVLKSMVLMDESGGSVTGVTYPSNDPIA